MKVIFLDTETNGFSNCSVLSVCAIKCELDNSKKACEIIKKEEFVRYYFPKEKFNMNAIEVNGLSYEVIEKKRYKKSWPIYFEEDANSFINFVSDCDHLVCHNVDFDKKFLPVSFSNEFCTMRNFSSYYKNKCQKNKNPKLSDLVDLFEIDTRIMNGSYHEAEYDVECLIKIFESGYNILLLKSDIDNFLNLPVKNYFPTRKIDPKISSINEKNDMSSANIANHKKSFFANSIKEKFHRFIDNCINSENKSKDNIKSNAVDSKDNSKDDQLLNILRSFDDDLSFTKLTPFPSQKLSNLTKQFSKKSSLIVRNIDNCCCDDGCREKEIQPRIIPKVERCNHEYKIFGNRAEDVFPLISKIYKHFGKNETKTYIVGEYLHSLQHKYIIPNGKVPVKIGKTRITLDLNHETYIIYPERQSSNFYYVVEVTK